LIGFALVDLDLAAFSFQVPTVLSAPDIPMAAIATPISSLAPMFRMVFISFLTLAFPANCLEFSGGMADRIVGGNNKLWLITPTASFDQPGFDHITGGVKNWMKVCLCLLGRLFPDALDDEAARFGRPLAD
jgi:hypothetical protein